MEMTDPMMPPAAAKYILTRPGVPAPLDPNFCPFILGKMKYVKAVQGCPGKLEFAIERPGGCCGRDSLPVFPEDHEGFEASVFMAGEVIRYMLWQRGGQKLILAGPKKICEEMKTAFSKGGKYEFEAATFPKVCGAPWSMKTSPFLKSRRSMSLATLARLSLEQAWNIELWRSRLTAS